MRDKWISLHHSETPLRRTMNALACRIQSAAYILTFRQNPRSKFNIRSLFGVVVCIVRQIRTTIYTACIHKSRNQCVYFLKFLLKASVLQKRVKSTRQKIHSFSETRKGTYRLKEQLMSETRSRGSFKNSNTKLHIDDLRSK